MYLGNNKIYYVECKTEEKFFKAIKDLGEFGFRFSNDFDDYWKVFKERTIIILGNGLYLMYGTYGGLRPNIKEKIIKLENYKMLEEEY